MPKVKIPSRVSLLRHSPKTSYPAPFSASGRARAFFFYRLNFDISSIKLQRPICLIVFSSFLRESSHLILKLRAYNPARSWAFFRVYNRECLKLKVIYLSAAAALCVLLSFAVNVVAIVCKGGDVLAWLTLVRVN